MNALLAYDATGTIVATLDYVVSKNDGGDVIGLVDFEAHEAAGGKLRDIWSISNATGSGTWPEWLGAGAHDFRVELAGADGKKRIAALVRKPTPAGARDKAGRFRPATAGGHRRERAAIEAAIDAVVPNADGAKDIRHLVGGPDRPLRLDDKGQTAPRPANGGTPKHLPLIGAVTSSSS